MRRQITVFVAFLLVAAMAIADVKVGLANSLPEESEFIEMAMIEVNCTTASVLVASAVVSNNTELVHFPAGIDVNATGWENVTQVMVGFSTADSFLFYLFNNTSENDAKSIADALTDQLNNVFETSFGYNSTYPSNGYVNVTYTGIGVGNLTLYTEWLMQECLASDLDGFSLTFTPMTNETDAYTAIMANKESGGFNWTYTVGVMYHTSITGGTGQHTIDVLDLLNVESLAPSNYSLILMPEYPDLVYMSFVMLDINSNTTVTFVSCKPNQVSSPPQRGWYIYPQTSLTELQGMFIFGGDGTPVNELSLTFTGVVIPEFAAPMLLMALAVTTYTAAFIKNRFKRK